jgi:E3 SUMO-protein ligase NSE2
MPVATSSRRRTNGRANRQPSSDGIEEDRPTQQGKDDDVDEDDDEDEQPSRSARVKKEKLSKAKRPDPKEPTSANDDDQDDDEDRIDVENFKDQPLAREDASKVAGIIKDWEMIRKQSQSGAGGWMEGIGVSMADLMDGEEAKKVNSFIGCFILLHLD